PSGAPDGGSKPRRGDMGPGCPSPHPAEPRAQHRLRAGGWGRPAGTRVKRAAVAKIAAHRHILGGYFPLRFTWQAFPGPFGKRIGLVKTDVTDGLGRVQPAAACERKGRPFVVVSVPV